MRSSVVDVVPQPSSPIAAAPTRSAATSARASAATGSTPDGRIRWSATTRPPGSAADEATADFEDVRHRLFGIAHRILGRATDAEDVVQDVWIRWQGADRAGVRDRVAFLVTITTRVALNAATSARARREISFGERLPESGSGSVDPVQRTVRGEELELAMQLLIERLTPVERAVHVLREAFDYPFREIAAVLGISEANARQLARRAREHLTVGRCGDVDPAERDGLLDAFLEAARAGDMARLIDLLTGAIALRPGSTGRIAALGPAGGAAAR